MKKVILFIPIIALSLASCSGEDKKDENEKKGGVEICDCVTASKEMSQKMQETGGDEAKMEAIQEEFKGIMSECDKMIENASEEEREKIMEKAKNCQ